MEIAKREVKKVEKKTGGLYFTSVSKENIEFFSSGSYLLDCVLGGGWPLGRMSNLIGDSSTGKTLLAIEACANFHQQFPTGKIIYLETEAAFDLDYAEALGMPVSKILFPGNDFTDNTVEAWFEHLVVILEELEKSKQPCLYIVDSLDALSDRAELERDINKGTFAMNKQKMIGQLFRQNIKRVENTRLHLMIVSQVRENIGVTFGERYTRSGGKAMDFYATHLVWLSQIKKLDRTIKKQKRIYGIEIRAKCKKNKVGLPFREADFPIVFGYGVDDITAMLDWLAGVETSELNLFFEKHSIGKTNKAEQIKQMEKAQRISVIKELQNIVRNEWEEIETRFIPTMSKY